MGVLSMPTPRTMRQRYVIEEAADDDAANDENAGEEDERAAEDIAKEGRGGGGRENTLEQKGMGISVSMLVDRGEGGALKVSSRPARIICGNSCLFPLGSPPVILQRTVFLARLAPRALIIEIIETTF